MKTSHESFLLVLITMSAPFHDSFLCFEKALFVGPHREQNLIKNFLQSSRSQKVSRALRLGASLWQTSKYNKIIIMQSERACRRSMMYEMRDVLGILKSAWRGKSRGRVLMMMSRLLAKDIAADSSQLAFSFLAAKPAFPACSNASCKLNCGEQF